MITLRPVRPDDWPTVHSWASRPEACRYQAWGPNTTDESRAFTADAAACWQHDPMTRYTYLAHDGTDPVGMGELLILNRRHGQGEIRYIVHPDRWGAGLGTAIGTALLRIGFADRHLHRVTGTCDPRNTASAAILVKLGMTHEGHLRHTMRLTDGWRDSALYGILAHEWRPLGSATPRQ